MNTHGFRRLSIGFLSIQRLRTWAYSPFAGFLLGYPDATTIASVINPDTDAYSNHYALFAQDDWKVSQSLTINYGLRWEYHPGFRDKNDNLANFDPYYSSTINGQVVKGAIILPDKGTFANVNPAFTQSLAPIPILTAAQAGVPSNLRYSSKKDLRRALDSPSASAATTRRSSAAGTEDSSKPS